MSPGAAGSPDRVERLMTLSEQEFVRTLDAFLPPAASIDGRHVFVPLTTGQVRISYEALPAVRLGRSLELPQLRVLLTFAHISSAEREAFLARFDIAFQRGGG